MEDVLAYASSLQAVAEKSDLSMLKLSPRNTFRTDVVEKWDTHKLLNQAPQEEDGYYVVPKVIQQT